MIFDVKFDGRQKARLVAGGHRTEAPSDDVYSGVVSMEGVRLGFFLSQMNGLEVCAGDVGNAFLYALTKEKYFVIAGPEFGPAIAGKRLVIHKSLYGLKTSAACFHEHLSVELKKLGFLPSRADPDLWMKDCGTHYEYIARYVDDVIAFSKNPVAIMEELKKHYVMKGVGKPQYYLGGDVVELDEAWEKEGVYTAFSAATYISNCLPKLALMMDKTEFAKFKSPMDDNYHLELDDSPLCPPDRISKYKSLLGSANWIITLGRFDIMYATSALASYSNAPREGHMTALMRIFGYLRNFPKGQILVDVHGAPVREEIGITKGQNWDEMYPDAVEDIPTDMPVPRGSAVDITAFVDADHARDKVTRRSVTGVLLLINNTPLQWLSKKQPTVETSTYGSEMIATRISIDMIIEVRYKLRMLGVPIRGASLLLGDNMSVVLNTTIPSSPIKKKHLSCAYHRIREAIAAGIIDYAHISSKENIADIFTKPLPTVTFQYLVAKYLFRKAKTVTLGHSPISDAKIEGE